MRMYPREFPSGRRRQPKRQAERRVYEALAGNDRQGFCLLRVAQRLRVTSSWTSPSGSKGWAGFALQVKGGHYLLIDGDWYPEEPGTACQTDRDLPVGRGLAGCSGPARRH